MGLVGYRYPVCGFLLGTQGLGYLYWVRSVRIRTNGTSREGTSRVISPNPGRVQVGVLDGLQRVGGPTVVPPPPHPHPIPTPPLHLRGPFTPSENLLDQGVTPRTSYRRHCLPPDGRSGENGTHRSPVRWNDRQKSVVSRHRKGVFNKVPYHRV